MNESKSKTIKKLETYLGRDQSYRHAIYKEIEGYSYLLKTLDKDVGKWRKLHRSNHDNRRYLDEYITAKKLRHRIVIERRKLNKIVENNSTYNIYLLTQAINVYNKKMEGLVTNKLNLRQDRLISFEYREYLNLQIEIKKILDQLEKLSVEKTKLIEVREYIMNAVNERMEQIQIEEQTLNEQLSQLRKTITTPEFSHFRRVDAAFPQWSYYFNRLIEQVNSFGTVSCNKFPIYSI